MSHRPITTQKRIDELCARLSAAPAIGLDTEFLRVRTYFPKLALVQVSTADSICCIDPLAEGLDLAPLWTVLADPDTCKVMHAARQDVEVLFQAAGVMPTRLFDTQIAAGLLGYPDQIGYAGLVAAEIGVTVPKAAQRSDWIRRPLSPMQLGYAANDVRYLLALQEMLSARLQALGRFAWAREEFQRLLDPGLYSVDPQQAFRRVSRGVELSTSAQHAMKRLCAWRERVAQVRNLPRTWVLTDKAVTLLAGRIPGSLDEMREIEGVGSAVIRGDGQDILACLNRDAETEEVLWTAHQRLTNQQKTTKRILIAALEARAAELEMVESMLATRSDLDKLARGTPIDEVLGGWRRAALGQAFQGALGA